MHRQSNINQAFRESVLLQLATSGSTAVLAPMGRQAQAFFRGMAERRFLAVAAGQALRLVLLALLPAPVAVARMTSGLPARLIPAAMARMAS
ncbi:hypothetical protein LXO12_03650 [Escherichia coli]|uniref:hypothetical protein n=1 Tax=Escherichia coli TaxID=562 RepID=UPI001E525051|nr:hypothetical protein [Escherichia coli]MCE3572242.1 hypothetical protein [Escherichia coli]MCV4821816.1 hypothetical protein [Escherichia coli]MCV4878552.1 hypothetical protein [Escherichia coli]MDD8718229.1 hypothetical protein [Escherichia coli]UIL68860.1 hypothetical protein LZT45_07495 [Escherichia coli]